MWELLLLLFLGFISLFVLDPLFQSEMKKANHSHHIHREKREKMKFPSSHISTSLISPENSPCSSYTISRPSTPIPLSRSSSRRSLFSHELYDSASNYCYNDE